MKNLLYILICLPLFMASCEDKLFVPEPLNNPEAIFEELWSTFDTQYAPFEQRNVDWDEQYSIYRPMVNENTSDSELFEVFKQMLNSLDDGHVQMTVPNEKMYFSNIYYRTKLEDELFSLDLIENTYLTSPPKKMMEDYLTLGWIGDIGYVYAEWVFVFEKTNEILDYFADAKGLIIDIRHDGGGDFTWVYSQFGRFTQEERFTHRSKTKNGPGKDDYTDWFEWYVQPEGEYFDKPLVLLTDRYTMSAAERAAMAFKTLPNLVHMGDTTNGAHSTKIPRELPNGWIYNVVTQQIEFIDGKSYEGIGLIPDVVVENTAEEMAAGKDKQLEQAINHLK